MTTQERDLTGADARITANRDDVHDLVLSNPVGQNLITGGVNYAADFTEAASGATTTVDLNDDNATTGVLTATVTIRTGILRIRRLNPQRTILTVTIQAV